MDKFGRNCSLSIWDKVPFSDTFTGPPAFVTKPSIVIEPPLTVEFDITRNTLASANTAQFRIYNLSPQKRNFLRYNQSDFGYYQQIQFRAGYGSNLPVVFNGNIRQAWSVRRGTDTITQIECFDSGFDSVNAAYNKSWSRGTPLQTIIADMIDSLPFVTLGSVGNYPGVTQRGNTYSGSTVDLLSELTGGGFFIDLGTGHALGNSECIFTTQPLLINATTGLLNTPVLESSIAHFDMLFEPTLKIGASVRIVSKTNSSFNSDFKITGIKHRGIISSAVSGDAVTTADFAYFQNLMTIPSFQQ